MGDEAVEKAIQQEIKQLYVDGNERVVWFFLILNYHQYAVLYKIFIKFEKLYFYRNQNSLKLKVS